MPRPLPISRTAAAASLAAPSRVGVAQRQAQVDLPSRRSGERAQTGQVRGCHPAVRPRRQWVGRVGSPRRHPVDAVAPETQAPGAKVVQQRRQVGSSRVKQVRAQHRRFEGQSQEIGRQGRARMRHVDRKRGCPRGWGPFSGRPDQYQSTPPRQRQRQSVRPGPAGRASPANRPDLQVGVSGVEDVRLGFGDGPRVPTRCHWPPRVFRFGHLLPRHY